MIVLGVSETHCATAAILRDGAIVGCASEERFTRLKNDAGWPRLAIDAILKDQNLQPSQIDLVALAGRRAYSRDWMNRVLHDQPYAREYYGVGLDEPSRLGKRARKLGARLSLIEPARGKHDLPEGERRAMIAEHLGLARDRVVALDHHTCHAAAAYFGSPFRGARALVLTNDNSGDGLCATVSTGTGTSLERHEATPSAPGSLGSFYSFVTLLLGMKFGEHEYKVMGLAPYAPAGQAERAETVLRQVFDLAEGEPCRFAWKKKGARYRLLLQATLGLRFDAIAGGAQRIVEENLLRWARLMRERHGGERLALGGGVFMNVKANGLIASEEWVRDLFVFPSCGDESNAIGAAYLGYLDLAAKRGGGAPAIEPFGAAYLGPSIDDEEVERLIRSGDLASRHRVSEPASIEEKIAELLVSDGVVARCAGRMEFGARALGNRSILANPSDHRVVGIINRMIKNRDFWMPFAPSVLREREGDYLVNPKGFASPYMMLAFPTNGKRRDEIIAAVHPHDFTARAHIVDEAWNPPYHRVIREFEQRTGIGAVLNTSFNLHGEPLVGGPRDAVDTFERSGLPHLALGRFLISKK